MQMKNIGVHILVKEIPEVNLTLESIQHQTDYRTFTPGELTPDQATVIIDQ